MKKQRKLIGIITSQVEFIYQRTVIANISKEAFLHNYDIVVFSNFVKDSATPLFQAGERTIYNLINYELLDGIIIIPDAIRIKGLLSQLVDEISEKFTGPKITIDYEIDGFFNVENDDFNSIRALTSHMIEVHHATNLAFMTGPKEHQHSIRRLDGFFAALADHNLTVPNEQIYYGDFWYNEGERVANHMLTQLKKLPDAILCASDTMAMSVCDALTKKGIHVPDYIAVTGFDSLMKSAAHHPTITSMKLNAEQLGRKIALTLIDLIEGTNHATAVSTIAEFIEGESCGCTNKNRFIDVNQIKSEDGEFEGDFYSNYNYMMEELMSAEDMDDCLKKICWYTYQLGNHDSFYLSLCDNWDYVGCSHEASVNYNTDHYTSKMHLVIKKEEEARILDNCTYPASIMHPALWEDRNEPGIFFFSPVHFNDRCFGYSVISHNNKPNVFDYCYRDWLRFVGMALENMRVKNNFMWSNQQLEEFAQIDSLTKIFNRNGYTKYCESYYTTALRESKELFILMGDLNDLKLINDTYGHIEGDNALQLSAIAFQRSCGQNEKCFRYGGDEFILLGVNDYTKSDILLFERGIHSYLNTYNDISDKPYKISISLGYWHGKVDNQHTLDDYVALADKAMFEVKHREKMIKQDKTGSSHE